MATQFLSFQPLPYMGPTVNDVLTKGNKLLELAQKPDQVQKSTQAAIRSFVGIAAEIGEELPIR